MTDRDYAELAEQLLKALGHQPLWLFASGSLIWKPEFDYVERRPAVLPGWHRAYCLEITRWRGTPEQPGLMMGIDRGGTCRGVAFRLPPDHPEEQLVRLLRREISYKPPANRPGWHRVKSGGEDFRALAFTVCRKSPSYTRQIAEAEIASMIARAAGHWGSCAEYLFNTVSHLEEMGIRDRNLWRLQKLVAEEIAKS
jgi:cation transport protein ChaC